MSLSSIELWQRISAEGLASPMQCRSWAAEAAKSLDATQAADGLQVLKHLVELGKLTKYQAKILAGQSNQTLKRGEFHVLGSVKSPVFKDWLAVTKIDTTQAEWPPATWARWLTADEVRKLKECGPSLTRAIQLASVSSPFLQAVHMPEKVGDELLLQVQSLGDQAFGTDVPTLTSAAKKGTISAESVSEIIGGVAEALATLHQSRLVHGRLMPDRVFLNDGQPMVAVDPLVQEADAIRTAQLEIPGVLGQELGGLHPSSFLAPEYLAPGQTATESTDVYALGCLWGWLLTGKPLASGKTTEQMLASAASNQAFPSLEMLPEPELRVLKHALAKNPSRRFADAGAFLIAFRVAQEIVAGGKQAVVPGSPKEMQAAAQVSEDVQVPGDVQTPEVAQTPGDARNPKEARTSAEPKPDAAAPVETKTTESQSATKQPSKLRAESTASDALPKQQPAKQQAIKKQATKQQPAKQTGESSEAGSFRGNAQRTEDRSAKNISGATDGLPAATMEKAKSESRTSQDASSRQGAEVTSQKTESASNLPTKNGGAKTGPSRDRLATRQRGRKKKAKKNKFIIPVAGGCGFLVLLLLLLKLSGALEPSKEKEKPKLNLDLANVPVVEPVKRDPREDLFRVVADRGQELWLPPVKPTKLSLATLPPGGQVFVSWRPSQWLEATGNKQLLSTFDQQLSPLLQIANQLALLPPEQIAQMIVALYPPGADGGRPQMAARVWLKSPRSLADFQTEIQAQGEAVESSQKLILAPGQQAVYVAEQPLASTQSVGSYSVGPLELMREVAELQGGATALTSPMEKLLEASDSEADLSVLAAPPFLFATGRYVLEQTPAKFQDVLKQLFGKDTRAILLQSRLGDQQWYVELQAVGPSDRDAAMLGELLSNTVAEAADATERYFIEQTPHPHWRALAFRFPQMLRKLAEYTRVGVEDGVAIANFYLPASAAESLLLASWIDLQEAATVTASGGGATPTVRPLTLEQYLARRISVSFDQEPIENALQAIAEEANDSLPAGTPTLEFKLDGDAFENDGITRNQQLSDFQMNSQPVRDILTRVAKLGNPVPGITDLKIDDQKLLWVVADDPGQPGKKFISLTTRKAANASSIPLPTEFAP